jgi:acyl carrier protein
MEFEKVKAIIAEQMNIEEDKIALETSFTEDLGADSLDIFQIISELEEEFGVEFTTEDSEKIKTVGDAVRYIAEKANE